ncbi:MAG TPA: dienelactone hydrolase family protein [Candidatus Eisenbacteria bacterium]|nr:dienelactone hydrolase family protein [Candidatus Eisenbacteria bacterium]
MREGGNDVEVHVYPGAQHAFFNDARPEVHDPKAAEDTWRRTLDFFRKHVI